MSAEPEERVIDDRMEEEEEDDKDLEAMKARVAEMEAEAAKLRELQAGLDASSGGVDAEAPTPEPEEAAAIDARSVYVGNVDYGATPEELQQHFLSCGTINRITILCHKPSGHPKGYAYIEFAEPAGAQNAVSSCNDSSFRQRPLSVVLKRTNVPGMGASSRARGRGARGGYRGGGFRGRGYGFNPYARGRGSRGRGRGF